MPKPPKVYDTLDRPDVEVLVDDEWLPGEVRMVSWPDDVETHQVQYRPLGSTTRIIGNFTAGQVRADTVDRSHGRTT